MQLYYRGGLVQSRGTKRGHFDRDLVEIENIRQQSIGNYHVGVLGTDSWDSRPTLPSQIFVQERSSFQHSLRVKNRGPTDEGTAHEQLYFGTKPPNHISPTLRR